MLCLEFWEYAKICLYKTDEKATAMDSNFRNNNKFYRWNCNGNYEKYLDILLHYYEASLKFFQCFAMG